MNHYRVRLRFRKEHDLRLISHRDLVRALERLLRRAGIAMAMSEGFHPKPRLRFPSALALGVAGLDEVVEADLAEDVNPRELLARLSAHAPPGLTFHASESVPSGTPKAQAARARYELPLPQSGAAELRPRVEQFLAAANWPFQREPGAQPIDLRPLVERLEVDGQTLRMTLRVTHTAGVRPRDLLSVLGWDDVDGAQMALVRTGVELAAPAPRADGGSSVRKPCRTESEKNEARNADQRCPAGGVPDRDC